MMSRDEVESLIRERLDLRHHSLIRNEHIDAAIAIGRKFRVIVLCRDGGSLVSSDELFDEWREIEDFLYESSRPLGTPVEEEARVRQREIMAAPAVTIDIVPAASPT